MAASAANASSVEFCLVISRNTSPTAPSGNNRRALGNDWRGGVDVESDRTAAMRQAAPGGRGARLRCWHQANSAGKTSSSWEILLRAELRSLCPRQRRLILS